MEKLNLNNFKPAKKTNWILFLLAIIPFVILFTYLMLTKNDQTSNSLYYKVSDVNDRYSGITTVTQKNSLKQVADSNLLAKKKISVTFTGKTNNLGIIAIPFDTHNKSVNNRIIFRLKEAGEKDWHHQVTYNTNQFQTNIPFPFGFPIIRNSKNRPYTFEIESLNGTSKEFISISSANKYFFTKYKFSKSELVNNPYLLLQFFVTKMDSQLFLFKIEEIINIILLSIMPSFILIILAAKGKKVGEIKGLFLKVSKKIKLQFPDLRGRKIDEKERNSLLFGFLITFSLVAFTVLLTGVLSSPWTGQKKWTPYLSILVPSFLLGLNYLKIRWLNKGYLLVIAGFLTSAVLTMGILSYGLFSWVGVSGVLLIVCSLVIIPQLKYFSFIFIGTLIFLLGINSIVFINTYGWLGLPWAVITMIVVVYAFLFPLTFEKNSRWTLINKISFTILLIISFMLAFRSDSLFLGSSELHWNYYGGVIQTVRSEGELLWSAPSQYGLLNVLLPSLLPWTSRNSFFIFQAVLFFISSFILIKTVYGYFGRSAVFTLIGLVSLSLFYFADPGLIGPTLYPSSSAVRFFCCYILIYAILLEYKKNTIQREGVKWLVGGAYVLGALWSAESFLYCTAIYTTYLFSSALSMSKLKTIITAFRFLILNISLILILFVGFNLSYFMITRHFPDWSMFSMYAFGYANGFGELSIAPWGIHWAVVSILSAIIFIMWLLYSSKKYSEWIVVAVCFMSLWALTSYYVGRAVVNNVTAILPLIFYIFIVMLAALKESKFISYKILLNAVFLPWIIVGVMGGIGNPQFIEKLQKFKFAEDINSKSFKPDKELDSILESLEITKGARIAYYGEPYSNPVMPNKKGGYMDPIAGMPIPMTLLEEPIPEKKREVIVARFLSKIKEPVFVIYRENEGLTRFTSWKKFLEQKYSVEKKETGSVIYGVFVVRKK